MNRRILFVDDESNVVDGIRRQLRNVFDVTTAIDPVVALQTIQMEPEFAVVVSDMRMPQMSGVEFLSHVRKCKPDSVRVMLTGNQDQATAAAAVNDGAVFRFLNKPCDTATLTDVLEQSVRQFELITSERELLTRTLQGSIRVLVGALSIAKPELFGSADRLERICVPLAEGLSDMEPWEMRAAARLCFIGCAGLSDESLRRIAAGETISPQERTEYENHPRVGGQLIAEVPRLERVADAIRYQRKNFDGSGHPKDSVAGDAIPLGARILRVVQAHDALQTKGYGHEKALATLRGQAAQFDPLLLHRLQQVFAAQAPVLVRVTLADIRPGMIIEENVMSKRGILIVCRGQVVSAPILRHLENFSLLKMLPETILVAT